MRFIFSICILLYHSSPFAGAFGNGIFNRGYLAVDFYFIVTGYLMINSMYRHSKSNEILKSSVSFIYRKIKEIMPALIVTFVIGLFFVIGKDSLNYNLLLSDQFVTELLQIGAVGYPMIINSSWWYISTMLIAMSALFPLACKYKDGYGKYIAPLILIFILAIVRAKNININDPVNRAYIFCNGMYKALIFIILGNICFELSKKIKGINFNRFGIFILSIIEIVGWCVSVANLHYSKIGLIIHAIILTWNVALTFSGKTLSSKLFRWNIWKKIGNYGFYLYLCQVSVRAYVTRCYTGDYMMLLKKYVTVSLVTASIIYFIIEVIYKYIKKIYIWRMLRFILIKKDDAKQDIEP